MAEVYLDQVSKVFSSGNGSHSALNGVSFSAERGKTTVIVGGSGCGKTTVLRVIAGLERQTAGRVLIDGKSVDDVAPEHRDVGMVFQNYALYPHMSVYDNMAFGLKVRKVPKSTVDRWVMETARLLQLESYLSKKPAQLSGGQRQRVALGRALVRRPKVLLLDEPLSNLDAKLRVEMRMELTRLQTEHGWTMIYVTHDQVEAMTLAHTLVVMQNGHVEQIGNPLDIYAKPANRFVAGFVGSPGMNFLDGQIVNNAIQVENMTIPLDVPAGGQCTLGIRPEDIQIVEAGRGHLQARLKFTEHLGDMDHLFFRSDAHDVVVKRARRDIPIAVGSNWGLHVDLARVHVFSVEDGRRRN